MVADDVELGGFRAALRRRRGVDPATRGSRSAVSTWHSSAVWERSPCGRGSPGSGPRARPGPCWSSSGRCSISVASWRCCSSHGGARSRPAWAACSPSPLCSVAMRSRPDSSPTTSTWPTASLGFRLAGVFAYPNALGITAVLGLLLAVGFVADSHRVAVRATAAATTVPLALALYLSNSRGAWIALALGLAAALALTPARQRVAQALVPLATVGALAIWLVSRSDAVTQWDDPLAAVHDGRLLAAAAIALAVSAASISAGRTRRTMIAALVGRGARGRRRTVEPGRVRGRRGDAARSHPGLRRPARRRATGSSARRATHAASTGASR